MKGFLFFITLGMVIQASWACDTFSVTALRKSQVAPNLYLVEFEYCEMVSNSNNGVNDGSDRMNDDEEEG